MVGVLTNALKNLYGQKGVAKDLKLYQLIKNIVNSQNYLQFKTSIRYNILTHLGYSSHFSCM